MRRFFLNIKNPAKILSFIDVGTIPQALGSMSSLITLLLDYNSLKGQVPSSLCAPSGLTKLNVSGTGVGINVMKLQNQKSLIQL